MLDRLPVELLRLVLEHLAPLDYIPERYKDRRRDLRSCCLVSRTVRGLAQPLLAEVYAVDNEGEVWDEATMVDLAARGSSVQLLVFNGYGAYQEQLSDDNRGLKPLLKLCPNLVELRVCDVPTLRLEWLATPCKLRRLLVSDTTLYPTAKVTYPSLRELSLAGTRQSHDSFDSFLTPASTPSLRALALAHPESSEVFGSPFPLPILAPALLEHLDILAVEGVVQTDAFLKASAGSPSLVVIIRFADELSKLAKSGCTQVACKLDALAVLLPPEEGDDESGDLADDDLTGLRDELAHLSSLLPSSPSLKLLTLHDFARPARITHSTLRAAMIDFLENLKRHDVEVFWEEDDEVEDSLISPALWRRKREEKARARMQAVET
ncbi:hypothetical protein JCM8097_004509 [Rhodosporidiobolus ruineniae]